MNFEYNNEQYRIVRGKGTNKWMLLHNEILPVGWRLLCDFPAFIPEEDIIDRAKLALKTGEAHY